MPSRITALGSCLLLAACGAAPSTPAGPKVDAAPVDAAVPSVDVAVAADAPPVPDTATPGDAPADAGMVVDAVAISPPPPCTPGGSGFDTTSPEVAVDRRTCLAWQRLDPPKAQGSCLIQPAASETAKLCWAEATHYCQTLSLGGRSVWRLPTVAELQTIVVPANYPADDKTVFPQTLISLYWTSEPHGEKVACLDFGNGGMLNENIGPDGPQGVRCVQGP